MLLLAKRASLDKRGLDHSMVGAIAGAVVFLVAFFIGLCVFIYFYAQSSPRATNGPTNLSSGSALPLNRDPEKAYGMSMSSGAPSPAPSPLLAVPPTPSEPTHHSENSRLSVLRKAKPSAITTDDTGRSSVVSSNSLENPPTPGRQFL